MKSISIQDWAAIVAILSAITTGAYFVYKEFKKRQIRYRKLLNGQWTNEGCIGGPPETHYIVISLNVDEEDGSTTGTLHTRVLSNDDEMTFSISGDITYKSVKLNAIRIRQGNIHQYGTLQITFLNKRNLLFKTLEEYNDFFPMRTIVSQMYTSTNEI